MRLRSSSLRSARIVAGRFSWGLADQGASSLTNAAISLYCAHLLGTSEFGAFSLAYVTYGFVLNMSRGLSTDPFMVRYSGVALPNWGKAIRECSGTALLVGFTVGLIAFTLGIIMGGPAGQAFAALALMLPGLMLQDSWRFAFFALGRGSQAFLNDMVWAAAMVPSMLLLRVTGHASVFYAVLAWGGSATVAAAVGMIQAKVTPSLRGSVAWLKRHRDLGPRYMLEGVSNSIATQVRTYGLDNMLGLASVGYVQAAVTLIGPISIIFVGTSLFLIPEAARVLRRSPQHFLLFCQLISAGLGAIGLCYGIVMAVALPSGLGNVLLGSLWRPTHALLVPTILGVVGQGLGVGAGAGLHALGASRRSLRTAIISAVMFAGLSLAGTALWGVTGCIYGTGLSICLTSMVSWWQMRWALREARVRSSRALLAPNSGRHRRIHHRIIVTTGAET